MTPAAIAERIEAILDDARRQWRRDVDALSDEYTAAGRTGGPRFALLAVEAFAPRLDDAVGIALKEFATSIDDRGRLWKAAHSSLVAQVGTRFASVPDECHARAYLRDASLDVGQSEFNETIEKAQNRIALHQQGWTAPKIEPWHKRYSHWLKLAGLVAAYLAGLYTDDARAFLDRATGVDHHHPAGGSSSHPSP